MWSGALWIVWVIYLGFIGLGVYIISLVIKALKIYIRKNS